MYMYMYYTDVWYKYNKLQRYFLCVCARAQVRSHVRTAAAAPIIVP